MNADDLSLDALSAHVPGRAVRTYAAMLSAEADALAWARAGAPEGAVVVADYQASPRGRAGREWIVRPGASLAFSVVLRPELPPEREGWLYVAASSGLADVLGDDATVEWPDEVARENAPGGAVGVQVELGPESVEWAVASVLVREAAPPRGPLLEQVVSAIEKRLRGDPEEVLDDYLKRCATLGRRVRARLIPMGPTGLVISGTATGCKLDGALLIRTAKGSHVAVRPQNLGVLEDEDATETAWAGYVDFRSTVPGNGNRDDPGPHAGEASTD